MSIVVRRMLIRVCPTVATNGSRLCAGGTLKHGSFNPPLNFNRITND